MYEISNHKKCTSDQHCCCAHRSVTMAALECVQLVDLEHTCMLLLGVAWSPGAVRVGSVVRPISGQFRTSCRLYCDAPMNGDGSAYRFHSCALPWTCAAHMNHSCGQQRELPANVMCCMAREATRSCFAKVACRLVCMWHKRNHYHHPQVPQVYDKQKVVVHAGVGRGRQLKGLRRWWHTCISLLLPDECCGWRKPCPCPGDHACSTCGAWYFRFESTTKELN